MTDRLDRPTSAAGLVAFRALFGLLMGVATLRFVAKGWLDSLYRDPQFHFTWANFEWVRPWPGWGLELHYAAMALAAFCLALGWRPRASAAVFGLLFTYAELIEKSAYLNHYYLVSLLAFALAIIPTDGRRVPFGAYVWLRAQVGVVYVFAGLAKLNADWLIRAEPLQTWLSASGLSDAAHAFAWGGALFDLLIVPALLWSRTRRIAYAVAVVFHLCIWALFPIGVFSPLMLIAATVFFEPSWAKRWVPTREESVQSTPKWLTVAVGLWLVLQGVLPLRGHLHPGELNWHEHGFRFAWRVMLIDKTGLTEFRVCSGPNACERVHPRAELTALQMQMMATQPDMILQYAHHLGQARPGYAIHVDSWVSLNNRPSQRLIDPSVDLMKIGRADGPEGWILSAPERGTTQPSL